MYFSRKALISGLAMAIYTGLVLWISSALGLPSNKAWVLRIVLIAIGLIALGVILWVIKLKKAKPKPADEGGQPAAGRSPDEIDYLVGIAESKLKSAKLTKGRIGTLPALLLVGEAGSGKTSVALNCGLDPEHLAGQIFQGDAVAATDSINLWFARRAILVEAAESVLSDPVRWARLVRRVAPARLGSVFGRGGQAPRALVVCFDCESFKTASVDAITARARNLQARLREASEILGTSLPVYVFFTRADSLPFFAEYVAGLSDAEAEQVLGVTLPVQDYRTGLYVQDQTNRLNTAYEGMFRSLDEHRADYLAREQDPARLPGIYEFPREFHKLQPRLVQLMVELCRPSHLTAGPFLRGFYFTGVRMVLEEARPSSGKVASPASPSTEQSPVGATQVFDARQWQASPATVARRDATLAGATKIFTVGLTAMLPAGTIAQPEQARWVPQWCFLSHLFGDLVLQDHSALGASGSSSKVSFWRRALLAAAAATCLVFAVGFTVSFVNNRSLIEQVNKVEQIQPPDDLVQLDKLRTTVQYLDYDRAHHHLGERWWLYMGSQLYDSARDTYFDRFQKLLLDPVRQTLATRLQEIQKSNPGYSNGYDDLNAYLITTSNPDNCDPKGISGILLTNRWLNGRAPANGEDALAQKQFDYYLAQFHPTNPRPIPVRGDILAGARAYLVPLVGVDSFYEGIIDDVSKTHASVSFRKDAAWSTTIVPGAFTKDAWQAVQNRIKHPSNASDTCVLGTEKGVPSNLASLEPQLTEKYQQDYIERWRAFLRNSSVATFADVNGGTKRLAELTSDDSPLLDLLCYASYNTSADQDPEHKTDGPVYSAFAAVRRVVPPTCHTTGQLRQDVNADYMKALGGLKSCFETAVQLTGDNQDQQKQVCLQTGIGPVENAVDAFNFAVDKEGQLDKTVERLLRTPSVSARGALQPKPKPAAGGGAACTDLRTLSEKSGGPSGDDVKHFFGPGGPVAGLTPPNDQSKLLYRSFYGTVTRIQQYLYPDPDHKTLGMKYSVSVQPPPQTSFVLTIGGQSLSEANKSKQFIWAGSANERVDLQTNKNTPISQPDIFSFLSVEANPTGTMSGRKFVAPIPVGAGNPSQQPRLDLIIDAGDATTLFDPKWPSHLHCSP